jgi:hypothetical protein
VTRVAAGVCLLCIWHVTAARAGFGSGKAESVTADVLSDGNVQRLLETLRRGEPRLEVLAGPGKGAAGGRVLA